VTIKHYYVRLMTGRKKYTILLPILLVLSCNAFSQNQDNSLYFWKLNSISGEARLNGLYREQERIGLNINEYQKSSYLSGGLFINTKSSILNPNFLELDLDAGYMPETSRDNFIIIPDQAEVRTLKKLGVGASFLKNKKITLSLFGNYDESFSSRENLTDIKSVNTHMGGSLGYSSKILPITIDFHNRKWREEEVQTGRTYTLDQNVFSARMNKSFTKYDRNEFRYSHDENVNVNQSLFRVENIVDDLNFFSFVNLDKDRKYSLNTMVTNFDQHGNIYLKRFQATENINLRLPAHLTFYGTYNYHNIIQPLNELVQHGVNTSLSHKLFQSLQTRINFDYNTINHTVYQEMNTKAGIEFNYNKEIPGGMLMLNYKFDRYHQDYTSEPVALHISNEEYILTDNKIILLRLPDVNLESVILKDSTGTIVYSNGLDYLLIQRTKYIEIRRVPGGLVTNNTVVLVDYSATQPGAYQYDADTHVFDSGIYLFKNLLSINYRFSTQDYSNLQTTDYVTLNYFTQNLIGCRLDFGFVNGGAEYEDYQSSILPYTMMKYYLNFQKSYKEKIMFMLNGNMQDYTMLDEAEPKKQQYMDVTGKMIYSLFKRTNLNVDVMYRKQTGRGIDLDLLNAKTEITSTFSRLLLTLGAEIYRRNYIGEKINFTGMYIKMVRKF